MLREISPAVAGAPILGPSSFREVAGATREVSYLRVEESPYGTTSWYNIDLYFDKEFGLMVEMAFSARGLYYSRKMTNTNLWTPNWIIYLLIIVVLIIIAVVVILLYRRQRTPS